MNILIVGNGFDLSHYLPTKYDHFMVAMDAIEKWDETKGDMGFDDLFGNLYEKEDYFFGYTKAMYKTDEIKISLDQIEVLKEQLKDNVWYQYFSDHVREVKTWIDFETKIKKALEVVFNFFEQVENLQKKTDWFGLEIHHRESEYSIDNIVLRKNESYILSILKILKGNFYYTTLKDSDMPWGDCEKDEVQRTDDWNECHYKLNEIYTTNFKSYNEFNFQYVVNDLQLYLDRFIVLFKDYLSILECLNLQNKIKKNEIFNDRNLLKIYSFNYTKTPEKIYNVKRIDFLHGNIESSNIVLGVSDLSVNILEKYNFYGFTKYHQKIFKKTNYKFLYENLVKINDTRENIDFWSNSMITDTWKSPEQISSDQRALHQWRTELKEMQGCIYIWGHSLDVSDENYIKEIFSINSEKYKNFEVVIFSFGKQAYFDHLCNLIHILGREKVELWMKKGWLKFEENPDIAKLNGIEPVDLPKISAS
ncbi:hypothetical protein DYI81_09330 [Acinetobacter sp. SWAC5]|uniref:AbiH family protein n=1 Tax=Acinetobacter sp. SWAC5 TaxID=2293835 RepID=UPI000E344E80|nr:AbiH family protein [Acinetobacter sp. SWAC5]RFS30738.1 hypothetical protein DYI81_09330 [Acinetobacter sp. SWAC5]